MPKLDGTLIAERLMKRIAELEAGEEVAVRDIKVLLNDAQRDALDKALAEQEKLRDGKRARNDKEKLAMGIKSKREVRIEAFKSALNDAYDAEIVAWDKKLRDAEVRQARIYFDTLIKAEAEEKEPNVARNMANNALTKAGLRRLDGQTVLHENPKDKVRRETEEKEQAEVRKSMTSDELEQLEILEAHNKWVAKSGASAGGRSGKARK